MLNKEIKENLIKQLKDLGFKSWKKRGESTLHYSQKCGQFTVFIYLSNQIKVFIETCGEGTYYIKVKENSYSYKDLGSKIHTWELVKLFQQKVTACEFMNRELIACDECEQDFPLSELKPYKYEPSRIVCECCHDTLMEG